ncbi:hypothetical protein EON65_16065 [archaeon]|nr:MAG: hypothetical protein EON65_16065 [archaeon]
MQHRMGKKDSEDTGEHWMLKDKRATRGKRMASLVGEAEEEDEQFWGNEVWQENDSDAESYSTEEEVKPDQFDSDFNDTEDDDDDEDGDDSDDDRERHGKVRLNYDVL